MAKIEPNETHRAFHDDVVAVMKKHEAKLHPMEMLALAAQLTGKLIALQDQNKVTRDAVINMVLRNIESGNQQAIVGLSFPAGNG